ncbi:MAG: hypothetical protein J7L64_07075, partial [Acidobacteria bacterium]|nr:hypothetical protein [Acidobacteriota bacterium]
IYNTLKAEFVNYFYQLLKNIDWATTLLINDTEICSKIIKAWEEIENFYERRGYNKSNRLKGILYEILFWYSSLKDEILFKQGWLLSLMGEEKMKKVVENEPIRLEIIPLYEPKPPLCFSGGDKGKINPLPQIQADFLILYTKALNSKEFQNNLELEFIDVKSSPPKREEKIKWQEISAHWFGCSFAIAYPQEGREYPCSLKEWKIERPSFSNSKS